MCTNNDFEQRALAILHESYGDRAEFHPGQLEAIVGVLEGKNSLVVQKTGWGKSLVYFIATKIMREDGAGPTIILSPLLALMENQIDAAEGLGVKAETINSGNKDDWDVVYELVDDNCIDALIISPERLANEVFMEHLSKVRGVKLVVVDEAHCISDWGHDFRPDYQRVSRLVDGLLGDITVLGTTATANDRVVKDVTAQLGKGTLIVRGDLMRDDLAIQVNPPQTREQRLAWLAQVLVEDGRFSTGQGIIYCLTHNDCEAVAEYLSRHGVSIRPYYSGVGKSEDGASIDNIILDDFVRGDVRILAATTKLGMGYDKSDIRFVIHFQLPQNLIAYYQQIGRAGRDGQGTYAILLHGQEDEDVLKHFIDTAQASPELLDRIVQSAQHGARLSELLQTVNEKESQVVTALRYLMVHDYLYKDGHTYRANVSNPFDPVQEGTRQKRITETCVKEHMDLLRYLKSDECYMSYVARELDAPDGMRACGICANCVGHYLIPVGTDQQMVADATQYLGNRHAVIKPRKKWAAGGNIAPGHVMQPGWCLCADYYSEVGQKVSEGKYRTGKYPPELVAASARYLQDQLIGAGCDLVVPVPSPRHPRLVPDFAQMLAESLGIDYAEAVAKTETAAEQKNLLNSAQQEANVRESTDVSDSPVVKSKTILLVDDMVDSRWTFTVIADKLLEAGAKSVYPFALVRTGSSS